MKKLALITGASRGIGKAIARKLAAENYDLILTCLKNEELLSQLATELNNNYRTNCTIYVGDISEENFINQIFNNISHLDVLINNAGISHVGLLQDMSLLQWNHVISTNLTSAFITCKQAIPIMLSQQGGSIVNISSMWGNVGASTEVAYSASKGGLNAFTKALAKELAPSGIQVNAIACGVVDTDMNSHLSTEEKASLAADIPADRFANPSEIADAVSAIISAGPYLTGQIIGVDGGYI